jgi:hypothetical protein
VGADNLERLACLVKDERFEEEKARFLDELHARQARERKRSRNNDTSNRRKYSSFWGWLFGRSIIPPKSTTKRRCRRQRQQ